MKPHKLITVGDFNLWVLTLPGGPRVRLVEDAERHRVTLMFHRNHRRRFKHDEIRQAMTFGLELELKTVAHAKLVKRFEVVGR